MILCQETKYFEYYFCQEDNLMKAVMSGQKIPLYHRLLSSINIFRAYRNGIFGNAESAITSHKQILELLEKHTDSEFKINKVKVLDLGCGQTATQTVLFKADGASIIGVDLELPSFKMSLNHFIRIIKNNGTERAIKSFLRHIFFDKRFFSEIFLKYGKTVKLDNLDIRIMNAANLDFLDNNFDFVYSFWVFEHINKDDVQAAILEINRVLKPTGIAFIGVHLFPSLSGGHHLDWISPDKLPSKKIPPWDHLFESKHPVNTYLNRLRLAEYREIFHKHINVFEEILGYEGERLLSHEIESKLQQKGYTREDLSTRTILFLCRKKIF